MGCSNWSPISSPRLVSRSYGRGGAGGGGGSDSGGAIEFIAVILCCGLIAVIGMAIIMVIRDCNAQLARQAADEAKVIQGRRLDADAAGGQVDIVNVRQISWQRRSGKQIHNYSGYVVDARGVKNGRTIILNPQFRPVTYGAVPQQGERWNIVVADDGSTFLGRPQ